MSQLLSQGTQQEQRPFNTDTNISPPPPTQEPRNVIQNNLPTGVVEETYETTVETAETVLNFEYNGNTTRDYITAAIVALIVWAALLIFKTIVIMRLKHLSKRTKTKIDDIIIDAVDHINFPFYFSIAIYSASRFLAMPEFIKQLITNATIVIVSVYGALAVKTIVLRAIERYFQKRAKAEDDENDKEIDKGFLSFLKTSLQIVIWVIVALLILQNIGYNVGALLGGLGIAGIALAFSLQNVLSDLFAYVSIFMDKPFKVGDFIIVGGDMGVVKHIGIKTTRIKTLEGQELIMTNKELTEARVNNYKRMEERRVVFTFGILYETPHKKLKEIPGIVEDIIENVEILRHDRTHFHAFGDFSLNFEVVYYVKSPDYNTYMDCQQKINLDLVEAFEKKGIVFAYPTQQLYVTQTQVQPTKHQPSSQTSS
jgi:small-conductance mechanosensitive channel